MVSLPQCPSQGPVEGTLGNNRRKCNGEVTYRSMGCTGESSEGLGSTGAGSSYYLEA